MLLLMENGNKSIEPLTDKFCFKPCSPNCEHQKFRIICMKFIFLLCFSLLSACNSPKTNLQQKDLQEKQPITNYSKTFHYSNLHYSQTKYNLNKFLSYQTFNEFKMRGVGKPKMTPFVYVKKTRDTIIVIPSNDMSNVKVYYRQGNRWYNHINLELWKKGQPITKSSLEEPARTYDRICGNDTILEYQCNYLGDVKYKQFYIKTPKMCVNIKLIKELDFVNGGNTVYNEMLKFVHMFNHEREKLLMQHGQSKYDKRKIYCYSLQEKAHTFVYQCIEMNETLYFSKTSLGLFGIQPGIEKYDREHSQVAGY